MDWRIIPSLSALRAFEATARTHSFSAAARELNVTHAAVAQHVRALESRFGEQLVFRQGQEMALTDSGMRLAATLEDGFTTIQAGILDLMDRQTSRPLQVSMTPSFAETWLMPRLGAFWTSHPGIEVAINPSMALVDLRRDGFDLAIRFGDGNWPGYTVEPLTHSPFAIVGAPSLVQGRSLSQIGDLSQYNWFSSSAATEQDAWGASIGIDFSQFKTKEMSNNGLAIAAVRSGYGLSVQVMTLVQPDLDTGRLVCIYQGDPAGLGYYIVTRKEGTSPTVATFVKWLRKTVRDEAAR